MSSLDPRMNTSLRCLEATGEQSAKRKVGRGIEDRIEMGEKLEGSDVKRSGCRRFLAIGHRHEEPVRGLFHLDDVAGPQGFVVKLLASKLNKTKYRNILIVIDRLTKYRYFILVDKITIDKIAFLFYTYI